MPYQLPAGQWRAARNGPTLSGLGCNMLPFVILRARRSYSLASASPEHLLLHRGHFSIFCDAASVLCFCSPPFSVDGNAVMGCGVVLLRCGMVAAAGEERGIGQRTVCEWEEKDCQQMPTRPSLRCRVLGVRAAVGLGEVQVPRHELHAER